MKLFGGFVRAIRAQGTKEVITPIALTAKTKEEALGVALTKAKKEYPATAGWGNHAADVVEISQKSIKKVSPSCPTCNKRAIA